MLIYLTFCIYGMDVKSRILIGRLDMQDSQGIPRQCSREILRETKVTVKPLILIAAFYIDIFFTTR